MSPDDSYIPNPNEDRLLPPAQKSGTGGLIGIFIILALLIIGALYFWGAHLNAQKNPENQLPLIPASDSSTTISTSTAL